MSGPRGDKGSVGESGGRRQIYSRLARPDFPTAIPREWRRRHELGVRLEMLAWLVVSFE